MRKPTAPGRSSLEHAVENALAARYRDDEKRHALMLAKKRLRRMAPENLLAHATLIHQLESGAPVIAQRHHAEWAKLLQAREENPFLCIVAPPGYAKSTWGSVIYPTWRIGSSKGRVRFGLISNTKDQAFGYSQAVWSAIQTPEFQRTYPGVQIDPKRGSGQGRFFVTGAPMGPNPTMLASGIGGPILGKRMDEILVDDPITWADARSEQTMKGIRHWWKGTLIKRLVPGNGPPDGAGRVVVILTRWSEMDLVPVLEDEGFKIVQMPALGYWDRTYACADCAAPRAELEEGQPIAMSCPNCGSDSVPKVIWGNEPLWPAVESREKLERARAEDNIIFELVMQGNTRVLSGTMFKGERFKRGPMPPLEDFDSIVQGVDTASGMDPMEGDYFAHVTLGNKGAEEWVLNVYHDRIPAPQQEAKIEELYELFARAGRHPDLVTIEAANEGRAVFQHLEQAARLPIELNDPVGSKEFRAIPMSNAYKANRFWHADTTVTGERSEWLMGYEAELEAFPFGEHDDRVDAATAAYDKLNEAEPRVRVLG